MERVVYVMEGVVCVTAPLKYHSTLMIIMYVPSPLAAYIHVPIVPLIRHMVCFPWLETYQSSCQESLSP